MTELSSVWDGILTGDAVNAPYSATEWARLWALQHGVNPSVFPNYGVIKGTGDGTYEPLDVRATSPVSSNVEVQIGAAFVNGRFYETTALVALTVGTNSSGNARIDTVILRADYVAQTIRLVIKQGTPAASPVRPTLTQSSSIWEMPLADIAVANGFATLAQSTITQRQRSVHAADRGWLPYAYSPTYLPNGNYDGGNEAFSSGAAIAVPFALSANLLLHSITIRAVVGGLTTTNITWAIYRQDVNDGNTSENTLRRVYSSDVGAQNINAGNADLAANPFIVLAPGLYWVVMKNANASVFGLGRITGTGFSVGDDYQIHTNPTLGQTLDFVTGAWTRRSGSVGVRLNGRVFGQTTAY